MPRNFGGCLGIAPDIGFPIATSPGRIAQVSVVDQDQQDRCARLYVSAYNRVVEAERLIKRLAFAADVEYETHPTQPGQPGSRWIPGRIVRIDVDAPDSLSGPQGRIQQIHILAVDGPFSGPAAVMS